jgi:hypothetical protein
MAITVPFEASGADIGPINPFVRDLAETKAMLEMQKTSMDSLRSYRYAECLDESMIQRSVDTYNAKVKAMGAEEKKALGTPPFSGAVESQLDEGFSVTMGTAASLKLFAYDLAAKKGALADGAGIGAPIRFYSGNIHAVKDKCRSRSYRRTSIAEDPQTGAIGNHLFSITPTIYFSKTVNANDIAIQPALVLSLWNDILHFGAGFNLSGQNQGNAFLLFGIGTQLPGETK